MFGPSFSVFTQNTLDLFPFPFHQLLRIAQIFLCLLFIWTDIWHIVLLVMLSLSGNEQGFYLNVRAVQFG